MEASENTLPYPPADAINQVSAVKEMPHIYERLVQLWGYVEFFEYIDSLLLVETGREGRQGFPLDVYRELNLLDEIFCKHPDEVAKTATFLERNAIERVIKERKVRGLFNH